MVREANMKQAASEKQLKEAWGKVRPLPVCLGQSLMGWTGLNQQGHATGSSQIYSASGTREPGLGQAEWV